MCTGHEISKLYIMYKFIGLAQGAEFGLAISEDDRSCFHHTQNSIFSHDSSTWPGPRRGGGR